MAKKKSKTQSVPETIWLHVPARPNQSIDQIGPVEFGREHAMNILANPKTHWVRWEPEVGQSKSSSDGDHVAADPENTEGADAE